MACLITVKTDASRHHFCDALILYARRYLRRDWRPGWMLLFAVVNHEKAPTAGFLVAQSAELNNQYTELTRLIPSSIPAFHIAAAKGMCSVF